MIKIDDCQLFFFSILFVCLFTSFVCLFDHWYWTFNDNVDGFWIEKFLKIQKKTKTKWDSTIFTHEHSLGWFGLFVFFGSFEHFWTFDYFMAEWNTTTTKKIIIIIIIDDNDGIVCIINRWFVFSMFQVEVNWQKISLHDIFSSTFNRDDERK